MTEKNVIIVERTGQWFVRKVELWNTPSYYKKLNKDDEVLMYLGEIALNPKMCDPNTYFEKALFETEKDALDFIENNFNGLTDLHIAYVYPNDKWDWNKPTN